MFRFFQLFIVQNNSQVEYRQINADIILSHNLCIVITDTVVNGRTCYYVYIIGIVIFYIPNLIVCILYAYLILQ